MIDVERDEFQKLLDQETVTEGEFMDAFIYRAELGEEIKAAEVLPLLDRVPLGYERLADVAELCTSVLIMLKLKDEPSWYERLRLMTEYRWVRVKATSLFDRDINKE